MHIVEQSDQRLVLRDLPLLFWLNSALFFFLAWLVWSSGAGVTAVVVLLGLACACLLLPSIRTFAIDVREGCFVMTRRRPFNTSQQKLPLEEIVDVEVYEPARVRKLAVLNVVLRSDKRITLADGGRINSFPQIAEAMKAYLVR